jgi:iron complex transport system substrate-binding protein
MPVGDLRSRSFTAFLRLRGKFSLLKIGKMPGEDALYHPARLDARQRASLHSPFFWQNTDRYDVTRRKTHGTLWKTTVALAAFLSVGVLARGAAAQTSAPKPLHVMSLNLCTDQLVLQLLPPERIRSITYLSRSPERSYFAAEAFRVPTNYGTSEEVLQQNPDLVIAGTASTPAVRALLKRVGIPLLEVPSADSFEAIREVTRRVARAVGEADKGEALIRHMDATLAELAATAPERKIVVAGWNGIGDVPAKGTLFDAILTAAGGVNVVANIDANIVYGQYTAFDLEQLVAMRPDVLAYGRSRVGQHDLANERLHHPIVSRLYAGREITYPETLYNCGLPQSADAARDLRAAIMKAMPGAKPAP